MKGKSIFYMVVSLSMLCCSCKTGQHEVTTAPYAAFDDNLLPAIHAEGWIAEFLERQRTDDNAARSPAFTRKAGDVAGFMRR